MFVVRLSTISTPGSHLETTVAIIVCVCKCGDKTKDGHVLPQSEREEGAADPALASLPLALSLFSLPSSFPHSLLLPVLTSSSFLFLRPRLPVDRGGWGGGGYWRGWGGGGEGRGREDGGAVGATQKKKLFWQLTNTNHCCV